MIRALIFDCFGVLSTDGWLPFKDEQFGHSAELMEEAAELNRQSAAGLLGYDDFVQAIADLSNMPSMHVAEALESNTANRPLFRYIAELKNDYKIGLLSNAGANFLDQLFSEEQVALFDAVALSYQSGYVKPDPRAYESIAEMLGVPPEECVMIDDQERHCTGARDAGMQAVLFHDNRQLKHDLAELLGNSKN
jgi:HAD superfamily hydrolase (TIGR01509 family)